MIKEPVIKSSDAAETERLTNFPSYESLLFRSVIAFAVSSDRMSSKASLNENLNENLMTQQERADVEPLVRSKVAADQSITSGAVAEAASVRLGKTVTAKDIFLLRNQIGLGMHTATPEDMALAEDARILVRLFAEEGVRNTLLEDLHAGRVPVTQTGDYSDVTVVTPEGTIPWQDVSRLSDPEMRALMLNVEHKLAALLFALLQHEQEGRRELLLDEARRRCFGPHGVSWDRPQ